METVTTSIDTRGRKQPAKKKRRDVDDYLAEKRVRLAAKDTEAPGPAPQPTDTITLNEQLMALSLKLEKFGDGYSARVREWCAAHPKMPDQFRRALSGILENFCFRMQMLVQDIDGRNPDDHDEAASAPAGPPVGDDLDIPPCLKRT